jgi:hypothetical protein
MVGALLVGANRRPLPIAGIRRLGGESNGGGGEKRASVPANTVRDQCALVVKFNQRLDGADQMRVIAAKFIRQSCLSFIAHSAALSDGGIGVVCHDLLL